MTEFSSPPQFHFIGDEDPEQVEAVKAKTERFQELAEANAKLKDTINEVITKHWATIEQAVNADVLPYEELGKRNSQEMRDIAVWLKEQGFVLAGLMVNIKTGDSALFDMGGATEAIVSGPAGSSLN